MWLSNYEDGTSIGEAPGKIPPVFWTDLPKDKKIIAIQMSHPELPMLYICLKNYDRYYFAREAVAQHLKQGKVTAYILGAHDLTLGVGTEVRVETNGNVRVFTYPIGKFKYSPDILRDGHRVGKPKIETVRPVEAS